MFPEELPGGGRVRATKQHPSLPGPYPCSSQTPCIWPPSAVQKRGGASLRFVVLGTGPRAAGGLSPYRAPRGSGPLFPKDTTLASFWRLSTCHKVTHEGARRLIHSVKHSPLPVASQVKFAREKIPALRLRALGQQGYSGFSASVPFSVCPYLPKCFF